MKRLIVSLLFLLIVGGNSAREVININRNWQFAYTSDLRSRTTIDLPHTWNTDAVSARLLYARGLANYIKEINVPYNWSGKRVYIRFYGANSETNLFVNGNYVGEHKGGYTGFTFEITPFLKPGTVNNIWVRMNNSAQLDYMPINSDFNIYGGIYRDVELIVTEPTHIAISEFGADGVYLTQTKISEENARVDATVQVNGVASANYTVSVDVNDPETGYNLLSKTDKIKLDKGNGTVNIPLEIENPRLWNGVKDPFLYEFVVRLQEGEKTLDSLNIPMGLRYYEIDPEQGFLLNGQPYRLQGVTRFEDRAGVGNAYLDQQQEEDFDLMLEMGVNAVRMTNYPHSPYFYALCDRYGMIVWSELSFTAPEFGVDNGYINKPSFKENGKRQLQEMMRQRYNNTSVLFWGIFSNITTRGSDDPTDYIKELNQIAHIVDPIRKTVAASNQDGSINFITDLIGWSQYLGWRSGLVTDVDLWLQQLTTNWKQLHSAIGEYGAGGSILHQSDTLRRPDIRERRHPERFQTYYHEKLYGIIKKYPSLWGSFAHTMFDFGEYNYPGGSTPGVNDFGLVTYDRQHKKDAFYFYKANWNTNDPFVYIAEKRWSERAEPVQTIKVFSNQPEVEVFLNGESLGAKKGVNGVFTWSNIKLREGANTIEANAEQGFDEAKITIEKLQAVRVRR